MPPQKQRQSRWCGPDGRHLPVVTRGSLPARYFVRCGGCDLKLGPYQTKDRARQTEMMLNHHGLWRAMAFDIQEMSEQLSSLPDGKVEQVEDRELICPLCGDLTTLVTANRRVHTPSSGGLAGSVVMFDVCDNCMQRSLCPDNPTGIHTEIIAGDDAMFHQAFCQHEGILLRPEMFPSPGQVGYCGACHFSHVWDRKRWRWADFSFELLAELWEDIGGGATDQGGRGSDPGGLPAVGGADEPEADSRATHA